jgi:hypothetical protein
LYADKDVPQEWIDEKAKPKKSMPKEFNEFPYDKVER